MKYGKLDQAMAAANLAHLGFETAALRPTASRWARVQLAQAVDQISHGPGRDDVEDRMEVDEPGHLFASFHYGVYPCAYRALSARSATGRVASLIGSQTADHMVLLKRLAERHGFSIEFVQSGPRMVRDMRAHLAAGTPGLILLDIPWTKGEPVLDREYRVGFGTFLGLSTIPRLLRLIDPEYRMLYVGRENGNVLLETPGGHDVADGFDRLGDRIMDEPAEYERLHELHRFSSFDRDARVLLTFVVKGERFAVSSSSRRAWRVHADEALDDAEATEHGICRDAAALGRLATTTGERADAVVCL